MSCVEKLFTGAVAVAVIGGCAYAAVDSINNPQTTNIRHVGAADIPQPENMPTLTPRPTDQYLAPIIDMTDMVDGRFIVTNDKGEVFRIKQFNNNGCVVAYNPDTGVIEATNYGEKLVISPKPEIIPIILPNQIRTLGVGLSDADEFIKQGLNSRTYNQAYFGSGYELVGDNNEPVKVRSAEIIVGCMTQFNGDHQEISVSVPNSIVYRVDNRGVSTYVEFDLSGNISAIDNVDAKRQDSDPSDFPLLVRPVEPFENKLLVDTIIVGSNECGAVRNPDGGFTMTTPIGYTWQYELINSDSSQTYKTGDVVTSSSMVYEGGKFGGAKVTYATFGQEFYATCQNKNMRGEATITTLNVLYGDTVKIYANGILINELIMKASVDAFGEVFPHLIKIK